MSHHHHLTLTRRNAGLPPLEAIDASLRDTSTLIRTASALLPFVTLLAFAGAWHMHWYVLLPLILLAQFVAAVAYVHDVAHGSAGLTARQSHWVMFIIGATMLQSAHAFRHTHLIHHAHCLEDDDVEGAPARMTPLRLLLASPGYLPRLWLRALRDAGSANERRWMVAELVSALLVACGAVWCASWSSGPLVYCTMSYLASWLYPAVTAYLAHYKPGVAPLEQARTLRVPIVPLLFLNITYHLEHHLYPQVPCANLGRLARQLAPLLTAR